MQSEGQVSTSQLNNWPLCKFPELQADGQPSLYITIQHRAQLRRMFLQLISVAKMLLFSLTVCLIIRSSAAELFNIGRFSTKNGSHSADWIKFSTTTSATVGHVNFCRRLGSDIAGVLKHEAGQIDENSSCQCPIENATFGYYDRKWQCTENTKVRLFEKQDFPEILFSNEKPSDPLTVVDYGQERNFRLFGKTGLCVGDVSLAEIRYRKCNGSWSRNLPEVKKHFVLTELGGNTNRQQEFAFTVRPRSKNTTQSVVSGRILKMVLAFNCSKKSLKKRTLLVKFQGTQNCLVDPTAPRTASPPLPSTADPTTAASNSSAVTTAVILPRDPNDMKKSTSSATLPTVLAIVGLLILIVIFAIFCVCRRKRQQEKKRVIHRFSTGSFSGKTVEPSPTNKNVSKKGKINKAFLGDSFFRPNQQPSAVSIGKNIEHSTANENLPRTDKISGTYAENGYFQPIHLPAGVSIEEYKESLKIQDEEIYTEAVDNIPKASDFAGTRSRVTRVFEETNGEIVIALEEQEQVFSHLPQTDEIADNERHEKGNMQYKGISEEELYVNVMARDSYNNNSHDDQKYAERACYDTKERDVNSKRAHAPPVPQRSLSLENFQCGESSGEHAKQGGLGKHAVETSATSDDRCLGGHLKHGHAEQKLMMSDGKRSAPVACQEFMKPSDGEKLQYGFDISLPSPPPPSPPVRSLSLESVIDSNEELPEEEHRASHTGSLSQGDGQASDEEDLYTYATNEEVRNSIAFVDNLTKTYYGEGGSHGIDDVDDVCRMEPSAPMYVVLEPEAVEGNNKGRRTSEFTDQLTGVSYFCEDTEAKSDDETIKTMTYFNESCEPCFRDENCFEEDNLATTTEVIKSGHYRQDNRRGTSNIPASAARSYASVHDSDHCEHDSKSQLKFDVDANLYEPLIQDDLAKYYTIRKSQLQCT